MQISWLGEAGLRLQIKDTVVLIDPPDKATGFGPVRQQAHIVALSAKEDRDAKSVGGDPFIIDLPGEYERQGVFVYGLALPSDPDFLHFRIEGEDMSLGHLGGLSKKLDNGQLEQLEGVDILCVPVGGKSVLDADAASQLISQIEPRIVIPLQYKVKGSTTTYADVAPFLKEIGAKSAETLEKFKIVKKDLPAEETHVVVLSVS